MENVVYIRLTTSLSKGKASGEGLQRGTGIAEALSYLYLKLQHSLHFKTLIFLQKYHILDGAWTLMKSFQH